MQNPCPHCGSHCGSHLDFFEPTEWYDLTKFIGCSEGLCRKCLKTYDTGKKYWRDMGFFDRALVYLQLASCVIVRGLLVGFLLFMLFGWINGKTAMVANGEFEVMLIPGLLTGMVLCAWQHLLELRELRLLPVSRKEPAGAPENVSPATPLMAEASNSTSGPKEEEKTIHLVLAAAPPESGQRAGGQIITAKAWFREKPGGGRNYGVKVYAHADPLTLTEGYSSVYWRKQLDQGTLTENQLLLGW